MSTRPLIAELAKKAREELNEDPDRLKDDLQHMKDWIAKTSYLHARTDDQWLLTFLRGCKFSLERAKEKFELYYTVRSTAPEFFSIKHLDPRFEETLDLDIFLPLPKLISPDSPRVILIRPGMYDPNKYNITETLSSSLIIQKILFMEDDNYVVAGAVAILDLEGVTMGHFLQMTPMLMKKMTVISQDAAPLRQKAVHYLNTPPGFETVYNVMKTFMNDKIRNRLYVHNKNYEEFYKYVPKDILPTEYGGNGGSVKEISAYWKNKCQEYSSWLAEDEKYGTDESKRPGKPKTTEDMFGLEGSFRQLNFD